MRCKVVEENLCKTREDLICDNCINFKGYFCRAGKPPWVKVASYDSCGEGVWLCEYWHQNQDKYPVANSYLRRDYLTLIEFLESKLDEEKLRDYKEREDARKEAYKKEWSPKNSKEKFEHFERILTNLIDDTYAIKEKLGFN